MDHKGKFKEKKIQLSNENLLIIDSGNSGTYKELINKFLDLYEKTFGGDENQCEKKEDIKKEIGEKPKKTSKEVLKHSESLSKTWLIAYLDDAGDQSDVLGGIIFNYFEKSGSGCGLLSYIFTNARYQSRGIGSFLINEGLEKLINEKFSGKVDKLKAVFFETEDPHFHKDEISQKANAADQQAYRKDLPTIYQRLRFFKEKVGAKHIDIPYLQPQLYENSKRVELYLMTLPKFNRGSYSALLSTDIVMDFLTNYYVTSCKKLEKEWKKKKEKKDIKSAKNSELISVDDDLYRMEISLKIADLYENLDPMELLNTNVSRRLASWQKEIRESYLTEKPLDRARLEELDKKIQEIEKYQQLDKFFYLKEVPTCFEPTLAFRKCAVALHLAEKNEKKKEVPYCPFFHSWEKDLFSQRYEGRRLQTGQKEDAAEEIRSPYRSKCGTNGKVRITFKSRVGFTSEGRREQLFTPEYFLTKEQFPNKVGSDSYKKTARYFLNYTYFKESRTIIWEMIFSPEKGDYFSEFEITQISKYFAGTQEKYLPALQFELDSSGEDEDDDEQIKAKEILEFLSVRDMENGSNKNNAPLKIQAGTIQIDVAECELLVGKKIGDRIEKNIEKVFESELSEYFKKEQKENNKKLSDTEKTTDESEKDGIIKYKFWEFVFNNVRTLHKEAEISEKFEFETLYENINILQKILDVFSALCIGIFDSERVEFEEAVDTLVPREGATGTWLEIMNRSILMCFCKNENIFSSVSDSIGINPYLIIPNSVISHNIHTAISAETEIYKLWQEEKQYYFEKTDKDPVEIFSDLTETEPENSTARDMRINIFNRLKRLRKDRIKRLLMEDELNAMQNRRDHLANLLERSLNIEIIQNVFQYKSEQDIYEFGMEHRGVRAMIEMIGKRKNMIESQIENISNKKSDLFQLKIILITLLLTFLQIANVIGFDSSSRLLFFVTSFLIIAFVVYYLLKKDEKIEDAEMQMIKLYKNKNEEN